MDHRDWQETIDTAVGQLLEGWSASPRPGLKEFLPQDEPLRFVVLVELVLTDLEVTIRTGCADLLQQHRTVTEYYLQLFPELAFCRTVCAELFSREFRNRRKAGEDLSWNAFRNSVSDDYCDGLLPYSSSPFVERRGGDDDKPSDVELLPGAEFDNFRIIEKLGEGAFANVWLARQFERFVALKLPKTWDDNWTKEASLLSELEHPNIVSVHDARILDSITMAILVMQYHPGGCLRDAIDLVQATPLSERRGRTLRDVINVQLQRRGEDPLPLRESAPFAYDDWNSVVCWIGARLAEALDHAHQCTPSIIHGDIKPENVLFARDGRPLLADFNVSFRRCEDSDDSNNTDDVGGTWPYMSPEQLEYVHAGRAFDKIDSSSDVFSLGILLWELATGKNPFHRSGAGTSHKPAADLITERRAGAESLPGYRQLPPELRQVFVQCLAPDSAQRESAARIARRLHMASLPGARELLWPHEKSWVYIVLKRPTFALLVCGAIPNVAFVILNMRHNQSLVEQFSSPLLSFGRLSIIISLFSVTSFLLLRYSRPVVEYIRAIRFGQPASIPTKDEELICRCLRKSWIDWLAILMVWTLSGIILLAGYISLSEGQSGGITYLAFYTSQVVFGLVAASLTAISICFIDAHCFLPCLIRNSAVEDLRSEFDQYSKRLNWYVVALGLAQLIVFWRMSWFNSGDSNLLGMLALAFALSLVAGIYFARRTSATIDVLRAAVTPSRDLFRVADGLPLA